MWNAICRIILERVRVSDQSTPSARTQGELPPFEFYMYMLLGSLTTRAGSSLTFVLCALVFYVRYRRVHLCNSWILALVLSSDDDELSSRCLLFSVCCAYLCIFLLFRCNSSKSKSPWGSSSVLGCLPSGCYDFGCCCYVRWFNVRWFNVC